MFIFINIIYYVYRHFNIYNIIYNIYKLYCKQHSIEGSTTIKTLNHWRNQSTKLSQTAMLEGKWLLPHTVSLEFRI